MMVVALVVVENEGKTIDETTGVVVPACAKVAIIDNGAVPRTSPSLRMLRLFIALPSICPC
jgi:hypothetical protein